MKFAAPHSLEWFAIVDSISPSFGQAVRFTIRCERSADVCTICGDEPQGDYRIIEPVTTSRGIPTIRLCDGCLEISEGFGETLLPMTKKSRGVAARIAEAGRIRLASMWKKIYLPRA